MSFDMSAIDPRRAEHVAPERPAGRATGAGARPAEFTAAAGAQAFDVSVDAIPLAPPQEVMDEVFAAQRAIEDMHSRGRTLHFDMDAGRVRILLSDLDGNVLKEIPGSQALDISAGRRVE
jgi:hypothetical protein